VARSLNFSKAAKELHITQSALTQRVQNLEESLGLVLFVRNPKRVRMTPAGERLLRYCQARSALEAELMEELVTDKGSSLGGALRVAGFSTVLRSVLIPSLSGLLREHPRIQPYFVAAELRELPELLLTGEVDYMVLDRPLVRADIETILLGEEENVLCISQKNPPKEPIFLDHDPDDPTSVEFLKLQGEKASSLRRGFFDDIYGIVEGVAQGVGQAVVPRHIALGDGRLRIVPGLKPLRVPVYLHFFNQPYYTELHDAVVGELVKRAPKLLEKGAEA
jgi:DNA-binding transcriptional LysR family regulator